MLNEHKDAPETGRGGSRPGSMPVLFKGHHTNPAEMPGTRATSGKTPGRLPHASNNPPSPEGDAAKLVQKSGHAQQHPNHPASAGGACQFREDTHAPVARVQPSRRKAGQVNDIQNHAEAQTLGDVIDLRFTDPLVAEIVQLHRMRRRWMKAKNALTLQGKAFGRAICDGDKDAGTAAFDRVMKGNAGPDDEVLAMALVPFAAAIEHFDATIRPVNLRLEKLAKKLPIAAWVQSVTGLGFGSVAAIVGEAGDLSQYPSVAGVWKRMGLAVIDGDGRQRKVASAEGALAHGYNPERRSVVWVMADSMAKLQRTWIDKETGEVRKEPGVYGEVLEKEKEKALAAGMSKAHAEARGKRHMSKAVLRDMTLEWRRATETN